MKNKIKQVMKNKIKKEYSRLQALFGSDAMDNYIGLQRYIEECTQHGIHEINSDVQNYFNPNFW